MAKKVSEITSTEVADYLRLDDASSSDMTLIETFITVARSYVRAYTGLNDMEIDSYPDIIIAVYVLCQDMYDNRTLYVDAREGGVNKVVDAILGMHQHNLLPSAVGFTADLLMMDKNGVLTIAPTANDFIAFGSTVIEVNGETVAIGQEISIDDATIVVNEGYTLTVTPAEDFVGTITFEYTALQPVKSTVKSSVSIVVSDPNEND